MLIERKGRASRNLWLALPDFSCPGIMLSQRWGMDNSKKMCYTFSNKWLVSKLKVVGGISMEKILVFLISVPLMIVAIVCTLFADRIDTAVNGDKKVKKVIVVFGVGVLLICTLAIVVSIFAK